MEKQYIRVRRVGQVTFGVVLLLVGGVFLLINFFPQAEWYQILRLWPIVLIFLGIEVLLGSRKKSWEVLNASGQIMEQSKVVYDVPAMILTAFLTVFAMLMGLGSWIFMKNVSFFFNL